MVWERVRRNFSEGVKTIKWAASLVAERTKAETSIAKLLYETSKLERKIEELHKSIGKRLHEMHASGERLMLKDEIITRALSEIDTLDNEVKALREKAAEMSKPEL